MRLNASGCELVVAMVERMANQSMCGVQGLAMRTQPQSVQEEHNQDAELMHEPEPRKELRGSRTHHPGHKAPLVPLHPQNRTAVVAWNWQRMRLRRGCCVHCFANDM